MSDTHWVWAVKHQPPTSALIDVLVKKNTCYIQIYEYVAVWKIPNLKKRKIKLKSESRSNEMILLLTILTGSIHRIVTLHGYDIVKHYTCQCICSEHTSWLCKSIAVDFLYFQYFKLPPHCHINRCYVQIYIKRR